MTGVDRVDKLVTYAEENSDKIARIYYGYYSIIRDMIGLNEDGLATIDKVNKQLGKENKFAKFREIIAGREGEVMSLIAGACNPESDTYKAGLEDLTRMMKLADEIKKENPEAKPVDGDEQWDEVIWGYTNGADNPITDVHFCVAHGLSRILSQIFSKNLEGLRGPDKKDWLLNAMTEVVIMNGVRDKNCWEGEFYQEWKNTRPKGLGWISDTREAAYKDELSSGVKSANEK